MKIGVCKLCEKEKEITKHHLVPQSIVKKVNPNSSLGNLLLYLCEDCHKELHNAFITHIVQAKKYEGYNKLDALNYLLIKDFLKNHHKEVYSEWKEELTSFIRLNLEKMINGERKKIETEEKENDIL